MNIFQNHVYTVIHQSTNCILGTYPSFKKAYERIEEYVDGAALYDLDNYEFKCSQVNFETRKWCPFSFGGGYFQINKFTIHESLLTILPDDIIVSTKMFDSLEEAMKEEKRKHTKYRLEAESM